MDNFPTRKFAVGASQRNEHHRIRSVDGESAGEKSLQRYVRKIASSLSLGIIVIVVIASRVSVGGGGGGHVWCGRRLCGLSVNLV